jgi:hydroxyacylglutathione hydrolase
MGATSSDEFVMDIVRISALSDNYVFILHNPIDRTAAVVDPAEAQAVLRWLREHDATLVAILNTHHHGDHVGGNPALVQQFPDLVVYGGANDRGRIPQQQVFLQGGDRVTVCDRTAEVFFTPGHTRAHIAYYFPPLTPDEPGDLFCGDTLFAGGCGRIFDGTATQLFTSLQQLCQLPDSTRIWCAHEYTVSNLTFALSVLPEDSPSQSRYREAIALRQRHQATIPTQLGLEKQTNLFLRCHDPRLQQAMNTPNPRETFSRLRSQKDHF